MVYSNSMNSSSFQSFYHPSNFNQHLQSLFGGQPLHPHCKAICPIFFSNTMYLARYFHRTHRRFHHLRSSSVARAREQLSQQQCMLFEKSSSACSSRSMAKCPSYFPFKSRFQKIKGATSLERTARTWWSQRHIYRTDKYLSTCGDSGRTGGGDCRTTRRQCWDRQGRY